LHAPLDGLQVPASWQVPGGAQETGFEPVQVPFWQASVWVQALWSLQGVPFAAIGFEQDPLDGSQAPAAWHGSEAVHTTGFEPMQEPPWQASVWVQALLSLHAVPSWASGFVHAPLASQLPARWHWPWAGQLTVPEQVPAWQASPVVQALLSLQAVPSTAAGLVHCPFASQAPARWHWSWAGQLTVPEQVPAWQASPVVQALLSLQAVPSGAGACAGHWPVDGSQLDWRWQLSWAGGHTERGRVSIVV
jgi:hypothetical protein